MADVGLRVFEGVANGLTPLTVASKHNIGLLMERERGVPNFPILITSLQEDRRSFGDIISGQYGAIVVRNLFNNAGTFGAFIYGVRICKWTPSEGVGESKTAFGLLTDGAPANQAFNNVVTVPAGVAVKEIRRLTPVNPSVGDIFRIVAGTTTINYTVITGDTIASIVDALFTLIQVQVTASNPDVTFGTWTKGPASAYIQVEHNTVNTPISGALVTSSTVNGSAVTIGTFYAAQKGLKDPGNWGNNVSLRVLPIGDVGGLSDKFVAQVLYKGNIVETFTGSTWANLFQLINDQSYYTMVVPGNLTAFINAPQTVTLSGGVYVAPVEADYYPNNSETNPLGLSTLDGLNIQLIANTEKHTVTMAAEGRNYAQTRGNCMYIANLPYLADTTVVTSFASQLQQAGPSFIACYNCWIKTNDGNGSFIWVPSVGAILGAGYIRVPKLNQDYIHTPPAGVDSALTDCIDISPNKISDQTINLWVQRYTTNVVVFRPGLGFWIFSSRTMATNSLYHSVHVRRLTNYYLETLKNSYSWTLQQTNGADLRSQLRISLVSFFKTEYQNGALENSIPFEAALSVVNDSTVNPRTQDRKILNTVVEYIPSECTESVVLRLNRNDGILISQEG